MIWKLILAAYISVSFRTAKVIPNPIDYELKSGLSGYYGVLDLKYERDSGEYYKGLYLRISEIKLNKKDIALFSGISGEINMNEATYTDNQYLYVNLLNIVDILKVRYTNHWIAWEYYIPMVGFEIDFSNIYGTTTRLQYDTDFENMKIFRFELSTKVMDKSIYIEPKFIMNKYSYKPDDWQFKTEVGFKLGGE